MPFLPICTSPSASFVLSQRAMQPVPAERAVEHKPYFSSQSIRPVQDSQEVLIGACNDFCACAVKEWPPKHFSLLYPQQDPALSLPIYSDLPTTEHSVFPPTSVLSWKDKTLRFLIFHDLTQHFIYSRGWLMYSIEVYSLWHSLVTTMLVLCTKHLWPRKWDLKWCHADSTSLKRRVKWIKGHLLWGQVQELSAM